MQEWQFRNAPKFDSSVSVFVPRKDRWLGGASRSAGSAAMLRVSVSYMSKVLSRAGCQGKRRLGMGKRAAPLARLRRPK